MGRECLTPTPQVFQTWRGATTARSSSRPAHPRRVRLIVSEDASWDAVLVDGGAHVLPAAGHADATLIAHARTWRAIAEDVHAGMRAHLSGRLEIRRNLHLGVGFLAATTGHEDPARLRFRTVATRQARLSTLEAGTGPPVVAVHGLGGTKGSFLPTVAALAGDYRVIAPDLPGFGDSDKPLAAANLRPVLRRGRRRPPRRARHRVRAPHRQQPRGTSGARGRDAPSGPRRAVGAPAPSLAWKRQRTSAPRCIVRPELGLIQFTPRPVVETVVHRLIPAADNGWAAAGVDEFLRAFHTPAGRSAFYAAARHIYLEAPNGSNGFWPRLGELQADALFIWGRRDRLVPIAFARHVAEALPGARHLELDCGHVPQVERPRETHAAIRAFLRA